MTNAPVKLQSQSNLGAVDRPAVPPISWKMFRSIQKVYGVAQNMLPGRDQYTIYRYTEMVKTKDGKEKTTTIYNPNPDVRLLWKITKTFEKKTSTEQVFLRRLKGKMDLERVVYGKKRMTCVEAAISSGSATAAEKVQAKKFCAGTIKYLEELTKKEKVKLGDGWPAWAHHLIGFVLLVLGFGIAVPWITNKLFGGGHGPFGGGGGGASVDDIAKAASIGALTAAGLLGAGETGEVGETTPAADGTSEAAAMTSATKRVASVLSKSTVASRFTVSAHSAQASALSNRAAALNVKTAPLTWTQLGWGAVGLMALGAAALATSKLPDKGRVTVKKLAPSLIR